MHTHTHTCTHTYVYAQDMHCITSTLPKGFKLIDCVFVCVCMYVCVHWELVRVAFRLKSSLVE